MKGVLIEAAHLVGLAESEKAKLPISMALDADQNRVVISRYEDDVWEFWPYISRENSKDGNKRIIWKIALPDGTYLTDPIHAALLNSAKDFIWSLHIDPIQGVRRPGMMTLKSYAADLVFLLRWMVANGLTRFSHLVGRTHDYVTAAKSSGVVASTVTKRLYLIERLHAQAGKIDDFLPEHPWPFESAISLSGLDQRMAHRTPKTLVIPDEIFLKLARCAIQYVDERSEKILAAHAQASEAMREARRRGVKGQCYVYVFGTEVAQRLGYSGLRELHKDVAMLRTACLVCVNMFSGIRNSEMMSLTTGCISRTPGMDASYECIWLHGTIYKTGERPHKWLVPPIVERAVGVAERIVQPLVEMLRTEQKNLMATRPLDAAKKLAVGRRTAEIRAQSRKLFLSISYGPHNARPQVAGNTVVNKWLKDFCAHIDLRDRAGHLWNLTSHQFRRTFAYNYAKSELGDLLYLKEHFGHWSLDMTILYAEGGADEYQVDNGLLDDIVRAKQDRQIEILSNCLQDDVTLAKGDWLENWRPLVRTAHNKEAFIRELSGTITLNGTGHSWCAGNLKGGACGGLCVHEADMCVDCNMAVIGPEHLPVWKEIAAQQRLVLGLPDMGIPAQARARRILEKADQVVAKLSNGEGATNG